MARGAYKSQFLDMNTVLEMELEMKFQELEPAGTQSRVNSEVASITTQLSLTNNQEPHSPSAHGIGESEASYQLNSGKYASVNQGVFNCLKHVGRGVDKEFGERIMASKLWPPCCVLASHKPCLAATKRAIPIVFTRTSRILSAAEWKKMAEPHPQQ
jgi:hypothetical protein